MYRAEYKGVTVKITENQLNILSTQKILDLLIKKGLPIDNDFDDITCLINSNKIASLNCFKRSGIIHLNKGKVTSIKLVPIWR